MPISDMKARKMAPGDKPIADGTIPGLWLHPGKAKGHGKWVFRFVSPTETSIRVKSGKTLPMRRDMGFGIYPEVTIAAARQQGMAARQLLKSGKDPIDGRDQERSALKANTEAMTFKRAAEKVHAEQKPGWKNPKHADQWISTLTAHIFPKIGSRKVADLTPADFAEALRPIWLGIPAYHQREQMKYGQCPCEDAPLSEYIAHFLNHAKAKWSGEVDGGETRQFADWLLDYLESDCFRWATGPVGYLKAEQLVRLACGLPQFRAPKPEKHW